MSSTQNIKLERRQDRAGKVVSGFRLPGSLNLHKVAAVGNGKRTKSKIKSDSRNATS